MPRSAATILGLVLVAASIGFNTWRYPIVWRMAGPIAAPEVAVASSQPPAAPRVEPPKAELPRAAPLSEPSTPSEAKPMADARSTAVERPGHTPTSLEKPLAPLPRLTPVDKTIGADAAATVRRLPPVDVNVPPAALGYASESGGAVPMYPSTGVE